MSSRSDADITVDGGDTPAASAWIRNEDGDGVKIWVADPLGEGNFGDGIERDREVPDAT